MFQNKGDISNRLKYATYTLSFKNVNVVLLSVNVVSKKVSLAVESCILPAHVRSTTSQIEAVPSYLRAVSPALYGNLH